MAAPGLQGSKATPAAATAHARCSPRRGKLQLDRRRWRSKAVGIDSRPLYFARGALGRLHFDREAILERRDCREQIDASSPYYCGPPLIDRGVTADIKADATFGSSIQFPRLVGCKS
jgi:hypothetical protein